MQPKLKPLHALLRKAHQENRSAVQFKEGDSMALSATSANNENANGGEKELPWFLPSMHGTPHYQRLHKEIAAYVDFAQLTNEERIARDDLVARISAAVNSVMTADVHAYGSYASDLASYYSDIDIGVETTERIPITTMMRITQELSTNIGKSQYIQAKVPIVRGTCRKTLIDFDISFNNAGDTLRDVQNAQKCSQIERTLILVIKAFLRQRGLNTPHTGGISGHILTQMVQAYTQNRLSVFPYPIREEMKYATSLLEFMELYGILFNSKNVYIYRDAQSRLEFRCRGDPVYNKVQNQNQLVIITQGQDKTVKDIAGGAYNFRSIRVSLELNYFNLQRRAEPNESILKRLISVDRVGRHTRERSISISKSLEPSTVSERSVVMEFENVSTAGVSAIDVSSDDDSSDGEVPQRVQWDRRGSQQSLFMAQYKQNAKGSKQ